MTTTLDKFNPHKLLKKDLVWLMTHTCKHGHTYIEHPKCYFTDLPDTSPVEEKIGFLDIESTNLKASFGYIISWAIKEKGGKIVGACITPADIKREAVSSLKAPCVIDKRILEKFSVEVSKFDKVCVYWGKNRRHDIPFLRQRCLKHGIHFPIYQEVMCLDMYDWCRNFLSMHRYSLMAVCGEFGIPAKSHQLTGQMWLKAGAGNKSALDFIYEHNKEDCECLEPLYEMLEVYSRRNRTSI